MKGDEENQKQTEDNTDLTPGENEGGPNDNYIRMLMTEFFEGSDINDLIQCMHTSRHKLKILECLRVVFHWIKLCTCA